MKLVRLIQVEGWDGDSRSPYLFSICAEGLSTILSDYDSRGFIHGCKIARTAPSISHLFFAYDSFLFFKATMQESGEIKECLKLYEEASGQFMNFQKSSISFSCKYIGLPSLMGKNKKEVFSFIKDKAW